MLVRPWRGSRHDGGGNGGCICRLGRRVARGGCRAVFQARRRRARSLNIYTPSAFTIFPHTCAALSIAAGAHPKLISARLGHSTITITLDRYGHLFPSVEEALAEKLDAAFYVSAIDKAEASNVVALES